MSTVLGYILLGISIFVMIMLYQFIDKKINMSEKFFKILPIAKESRAAMTLGIWIVICIVVTQLFNTTISANIYIKNIVMGLCYGFTVAITLGVKNVYDNMKK